jgi:hypothetical protein
VAFALVAVTVVAALFLPRKREPVEPVGAEPAEVTPVIVH